MELAIQQRHVNCRRGHTVAFLNSSSPGHLNSWQCSLIGFRFCCFCDKSWFVEFPVFQFLLNFHFCWISSFSVYWISSFAVLLNFPLYLSSLYTHTLMQSTIIPNNMPYNDYKLFSGYSKRGPTNHQDFPASLCHLNELETLRRLQIYNHFALRCTIALNNACIQYCHCCTDLCSAAWRRSGSDRNVAAFWCGVVQ